MEFNFRKVKEIRKNRKIRADAVASELGINRTTFYFWESGKITPSEKSIRLLAKVLNVSVEFISDLKSEFLVSDAFDSGQLDGLLGAFNNTSSMGRKKKQTYHLNILKLQFDELNKITSVLQTFLNSIDIIFYAKGILSEYILANDAFLKNLSLDNKFNVFGCKDTRFYAKVEAKQNKDEDDHIILTGKSVRREGYIPGSRKKKWGIITKEPFFDVNEKIAGVVGYFTDITDRKRTENNNELLKQCIDSMPIAVAILNHTKNRYVYTNSFMDKITGLSIKDNENGREVYLNALLPEDREEVLKNMKEGLWPKNKILPIKCKDGSIKCLEYTTSELIDFLNNRYLISLASDITEKKDLAVQKSELQTFCAKSKIEKTESNGVDICRIVKILKSYKIDTQIIAEATGLTELEILSIK